LPGNRSRGFIISPLTFKISKEEAGARLDTFLAEQTEIDQTRSQIKKLIDCRQVLVNGQVTKPSYKLQPGDEVKVELMPKQSFQVEPEDIPLDIVYQDEDIVVVNKPRGMVVHPAAGNYCGTLVNALLYKYGKLSSLGSPVRPGIVHRLDKDTAGLIVVARNDKAYAALAKQFKNRQVKKVYAAIVHGVIKQDEGVIEAKIGRHPVNRKKMAVIDQENLKSRDAFSYYKVVKRFAAFTEVEVTIKTGRTHQIRVHLHYIKHPIVGDPIYGKDNYERLLLRARSLVFYQPTTGEFLEFAVDCDPDFESFIRELPT